jgi:hypothetical protein
VDARTPRVEQPRDLLGPVGNPFWVERYLDQEIGGVAGTYNLHEYAEQKTYVAYAIENKVREAISKKKTPMPPRPKE